MTQFLRILKSEKGFSLAEVMVGGAMLAGVALVGVQLFKDQKKSQRLIELEQKLTLYHNSLIKELSIPANCNATMRAMFGTPSAINTRYVPTIFKCVTNSPAGNRCADDNTTAVTSTTVTNRGFDAYTTNAFAGTAMLAEGNFIDAAQTWSVHSPNGMQLLIPDATPGTFKASTTTSGPAIIRVTYVLNPKMGKKRVTKDIPLNLRFATNQFRECTNNQESAVNTVQNDFCKTLNLNVSSGVLSSGEMASWDNISQTCDVSAIAKFCAQTNQIVDGIEPNGKIRCKPMIKPTDPDAWSDSSNTQGNCPAPRKLRIRWDGINKKYSFICGE